MAAVEKAMKVLKEFYAKAADAAFMQSAGGLDQEMASVSKAPYKGMGAGGGNIVDFLDVILSDFARLEAETGQGSSLSPTAPSEGSGLAAVHTAFRRLLALSD